MKHKKKKQHTRKDRLEFDTPGRECAHADRGCCPKCEDPMQNDLGTYPEKVKLTKRY